MKKREDKPATQILRRKDASTGFMLYLRFLLRLGLPMSPCEQWFAVCQYRADDLNFWLARNL